MGSCVGHLRLVRDAGVRHKKNSHENILGRRDANHEHLQVHASILSTRVGTERRHGTTTVPCSGVRAREQHHIIRHGASGEFGTDEAISAQPSHAHGQLPVVGADAPTSRERNGSSRPYPRMGCGARVEHGHMCEPRSRKGKPVTTRHGKQNSRLPDHLKKTTSFSETCGGGTSQTHVAAHTLVPKET